MENNHIHTFQETQAVRVPFDLQDGNDDDGVTITIKNVVFKIRSIKEDFDKGLFTENYCLGKRSKVQEMMKKESFDMTLYATNETGFVTSRPLEWLLALEIYTEHNNDVQSMWYYRKDKLGKYIECEIRMFFHKTSKTIVNISLLTGVFVVKGDMYKRWVKDDFQIIKNILNNEANENMNIPPSSIYKSEIDTRWEDACKNNPVITTVDNWISLKTKEAQDIEKEITTIKLNDIENKTYCEEKLSETIDAIVNTKIKKIKNVLNSKFSDVRKEIGNLKIQTQERLNELLEYNNKFITTRDKIKLDMPSTQYLSGKIKDHCRDINNLIQKSEEKMLDYMGMLFVQRNGNVSVEEELSQDVEDTGEDGAIKEEKQTLQSNIHVIQHEGYQPGEGSVMESNIERNSPNENQHSIDLLVFMDFQRTRVNWRKFWTRKKTGNVFDGNLTGLEERIKNENDISISKRTFTNTGGKDVDRRRAEEVLEHIKYMIHLLREHYEDVSIVINDITVEWNNR